MVRRRAGAVSNHKAILRDAAFRPLLWMRLVVDILLRASKEMDDAGRCDRHEDKSRQMMGSDKNRVDMQRQRQGQHRVHRAGAKATSTSAKRTWVVQGDQGDENRRDQAGDDERAEAGGEGDGAG